MGPSASEVAGGAHDDQHEEALMGLVKSLSQVQEFMKDPKLRAVVGNIAPHVLNIFPEGPEAAKPAASTALEEPPAAAVDPAGTDPAKSEILEKPEKPEKVVKPAFTPCPDDKVNSSTHRAAHARLARAMQRADPVKFPSVHKLWNGNRKDRCIFQKKCFQHMYHEKKSPVENSNVFQIYIYIYTYVCVYMYVLK